MIQFLFSPVGKWTVVALLALTLGLVIYNSGKESVNNRILKDTVKAHETRDRIDAEVESLGDYSLCRSLGGLHNDCDKLRGLEKATGPK